MKSTIKTFNHKRFLLFSYPTHYPKGGMRDLFGTYDTAKEAVEAIEAITIFTDFFEIYDRIEGITFTEKLYNSGKTIYTYADYND
jgi:hypothetical protein